MAEAIVQSEQKTKLRDRETMKTVWDNQAEMNQTGRNADMIASFN